jgi:putative transposase
MIVHQAYRFALDPTVRQRRALQSHCGAARFAFNWGLRAVRANLNIRDDERGSPGDPVTPVLSWNLPALRREWNRHKAEVAPWWIENSKEAYSSGLDGLARALQGWSASRRGDRQGQRICFPRFRKRGHRDSCRFTTGAIRVDDVRHITLPRLGRLRTCEATTSLGRRVADGSAVITAATVSREGDRWFVSFTCTVDRAISPVHGKAGTVGIDLGVLALATLSTGEQVQGPRALRSSLRSLRRLSRHHSRCRSGGANRRKASRRLARRHSRIGNLRRHHLHVLTTKPAKNHGRIVIEDLNVRGMSRSARGTVARPGSNVAAKRGLSRSLADQSFGAVRRMLEYKCSWYGSELVVADRFFASSKRCSGCGSTVASMPLRLRTYACGACGLSVDRDVNAARNLVWWAEAHAVAGSAPETKNACGGSVRPHRAAAPDEAGTGIVPEPAGTTGGRILTGLTPAS